MCLLFGCVHGCLIAADVAVVVFWMLGCLVDWLFGCMVVWLCVCVCVCV